MRFYSCANPKNAVPLKEAVLKGLAPDGSLFMPETIPTLDRDFLKRIHQLSLQDIAFEAGKKLLGTDISNADLKKIISEAFTFDAPLVQLAGSIYTLELFHGPTLSFKDFGARFMACLMSYLIRNENRELNILVATSGDTGSAVGYGFLDVPGIKVWILYPKGKVSGIQEQQLTTIGHNITTLEIDGSFDDCQALVKQAFRDADLRENLQLTSANSINIARLIPQIFYYLYAYAQLNQGDKAVVFSVPSGNFGNLTAGLFAKRMGIPVDKFIASTNINDSVPKYLQSGEFKPHPSRQTISNAMDVGNPSNFARMLDLYHGNIEEMREEIIGVSFTDDQTKEAIQEIYQSYNYTADPHGAVAYLGLREYQKNQSKAIGIFLETAHPAKFLDVVQPLLKVPLTIPDRLQQCMEKKKLAISLSSSYEDFKAMLSS